jgi:hypothetical protein
MDSILCSFVTALITFWLTGKKAVASGELNPGTARQSGC